MTVASADDLKYRIEQACRRLDELPLFHLSLHSKELFHSDFLAWLFRHESATAQPVFDAWTGLPAGSGDFEVLRERKHLDLILEQDGNVLVIENKVFSLPDEPQLVEYARSTPPEARLLLLSLVDPMWDGDELPVEDGRAWKFTGYDTLAGLIDGALRRSRPPRDFNAALLEQYVEFCRALVDLRDAVAFDAQPQAQEPVALPEPALRALHAARIADVAQKLRARQLAQYIRARLAQTADRDVEAKDVEVKSDFTRGSALLDCFVEVRPRSAMRDEPIIMLGWQLQGDQFRLVVKVQIADRERREQYVEDNYSDWFTFDHCELLGGVDTAKKKWLGYAPDFVYQYRKFTDLTVGQLTDLVEHYTARALNYAQSPR